MRSIKTSVARVPNVLLLRSVVSNVEVNTLASKRSELIGNAAIVLKCSVIHIYSICVCLRFQVAARSAEMQERKVDLWLSKPVVGLSCGMSNKTVVFLQYYLVNDTLEIREVHNANDGRDPFPVLINRHKVWETLRLIITSGLKSVSRLQHPLRTVIGNIICVMCVQKMSKTYPMLLCHQQLRVTVKMPQKPKNINHWTTISWLYALVYLYNTNTRNTSTVSRGPRIVTTSPRPSPTSYCIVLHCIALHCIVGAQGSLPCVLHVHVPPCRIVSYCIVLYCTVL